MYLAANEAEIFSLSFGDKSAPPLLALSGWIGSWEDWADVLSIMSEEWRAVSYDHRGSGATIAPVTTITFDRLVEDVFAVMDLLALGRCVLAAMSMGAAVALAAVLKQPERFTGLVIVNGMYYRQLPSEQDPFYHGLRNNYPAALDHFVQACVPEPDSDALKHWGRQILDRATPEAAIRLYELSSAIDLRDGLGEITLPTLILHGDADPLVSVQAARQLSDALPQAELVLLNGAGHVPIMTRPQAVAREIGRFFGV